ncbi:MAG: glycosyltransferase family 4 protein [Bacteroidetes bacterium]|nr:glycosyltransferase family 4 protein [Bacteroidota bacterium]
MKRLKIAYLTSSNPLDKKSWSGIHYHLFHSLIKQGCEAEYLGKPDVSFAVFIGRIKSFLAQKILRKRYDYGHSTFLSKQYAKYYTKKLREKKYDLIFAPAASTEIAFVKTNIPIVSLSDTTFLNMVNYYLNFTNLTQSSFSQGKKIEQSNLSKSAAILYPSAWAANSAMKDFNISSEKINIIPWGANLEDIPSADSVLNKTKSETCRLLFLGVDWERKGGEIAFNALLELNNMNIDTTLLVCGCVPPEKFKHEKMRVISFINKNNPEQRKDLNDILLNTDFLILPSKAECFGVVFCEASAYAIPSITSDTGGIEGAVKNNSNGFRLPANATGLDYAKKISEIFKDKTAFENLKQSSRKLYETDLNWEAWAKKAKAVFEKVS